jgi:hypothetical protein
VSAGPCSFCRLQGKFLPVEAAGNSCCSLVAASLHSVSVSVCAGCYNKIPDWQLTNNRNILLFVLEVGYPRSCHWQICSLLKACTWWSQWASEGRALNRRLFSKHYDLMQIALPGVGLAWNSSLLPYSLFLPFWIGKCVLSLSHHSILKAQNFGFHKFRAREELLPNWNCSRILFIPDFDDI